MAKGVSPTLRSLRKKGRDVGASRSPSLLQTEISSLVTQRDDVVLRALESDRLYDPSYRSNNNGR